MSSQYAKQMARLSANIFGEVRRQTDPSSMRVVKMFSEQPRYKRQEVVSYYPEHKIINRLFLKLRLEGFFTNVHEDFREKMKKDREAMGKIKPKKGEGKRAMKRK